MLSNSAHNSREEALYSEFLSIVNDNYKTELDILNDMTGDFTMMARSFFFSYSPGKPKPWKLLPHTPGLPENKVVATDNDRFIIKTISSHYRTAYKRAQKVMANYLKTIGQEN